MTTSTGVVKSNGPGRFPTVFGLNLESERVWTILVGVAFAFRAWAVLLYQNPMDNLWSDPRRHWDNAQHFMDPGPMSTADPVLYQFLLHLVQQVTHENRYLIGILATLLSFSFPLSWYFFAREVLTTRIAALRLMALMAALPTFAFNYCFFMTETLLMPLMGVALTFTFRAKRKPTAGYFLLAAFFWMLASLTRTVVLPYAIICLAWVAWEQRRRVWSVLLAGAIWAGGLSGAAVHSYKHFNVYSPFGNFNQLLPIYFLSGAKTYKVHFGNDYTYYFSSPSLYLSPFAPIPWESSREGTYEFTFFRQKEGADLKQLRNELFASNWRMLPRLVMENVIFLAFGHSWPESGTGSVTNIICLWERWIWFPTIVAAMVLSVRMIRRRGLHFFPVMSILFVAGLFSAHLAPTEGRYRKPIEPLCLLVVSLALEGWLETRKNRAAPSLLPTDAPGTEPAAPTPSADAVPPSSTGHA
jgi:hypothetical protein